MAKSYKDQADKRRYETFRDQHGRFWGANIEIETGDPCEVLKPQFTAPIEPKWAAGIFIPPEDVVKMVPRAQRARLGYSVQIVYRLWLEKHDARQIDYDKKMADFARGMNKDATSAQVAKLLESPSQDLLRVVGRPPFPPREFILAMAANNKWALGQFNRVPRKAEALLDAIKPILASAKERLGDLGIDPFEDDEEEDFEEPALDATRFIDPLGGDDDLLPADLGEELEEQFDASALGNQVGRPVPVGAAVGAGAGKGGKREKDKTKPPKKE